MANAADPIVFIVSGPSGSGKSTLVQKLLELPRMHWSVSCTTRRPRPSEIPGQWYNFVSEEEFGRMVGAGEFLEYARVFGRHSYGTPRRVLEEARERGFDLVLEIDVQGAAQVKQKLPEAVAIFILPPSRPELERRLRERGQDSDEEIARRLERARKETEHFREYDFIVVNDDLERAGREVQAIALAMRCRTARQSGQARQVLDSFGG
jgi:guanylate kinase